MLRHPQLITHWNYVFSSGLKLVQLFYLVGWDDSNNEYMTSLIPTMLSLSELIFTDHAVKYKTSKLINISFPWKIAKKSTLQQ